jgi:aspartate-semialdehyde dehydrogenase
VVPEVNPDALAGFRERNIIANPNCSTIQMVMVLKPLHDLALIRRVVVATYQSVSGAGREAMDELFDQTKGIYETRLPEPKQFPKQIAFNVIPQIDVFLDDGSTKEEWKMAVETKKILDPTIEVAATCVRVPVFVGHSLAVNVEFEHEIDLDDARDALQEFEGVLLIDDPANGEYVTPIECVGEFGVLVSRLRRDTTVPSGLSMWVVADNLRKGAALNAIQIAELLVQEGHL